MIEHYCSFLSIISSKYIQLYERELEKEFNFNDVMQNIPIMKPDNDISDDDSSSDEEEEDREARHRVGYFKVIVPSSSIVEYLHVDLVIDHYRSIF
jgi:hypothetical protein